MKKPKMFTSLILATIVGGLGIGVVAAPQAEAATCTRLATGSKDGRVLYLWRCSGQLHGQLINGSTGNLVYLAASNGNTTGGKRVASGKTTANSGSASGRWKACVAINDRPGKDWCTGFGHS